MKQSLKYYWPINLALLLGVALAAAILTGAFLTGDSVRGSLNAMTKERLGKIDFTMVIQRFFNNDLANRFFKHSQSEGVQHVSTAILLNANAKNPQSGAAASNINLVGIGEDFLSFFNRSKGVQQLGSLFSGTEKQRVPLVVINHRLQKELGVNAGDRIRLQLAQISDIHRESVFGNKSTESIVQTLRVQIAAIIPNNDIGRFGLTAGQSIPQNVFIAKADLQESLQKPGAVNAMFLQVEKPGLKAATFDLLLKNHWRLDDIGLKLGRFDNEYVLESKEFILPEDVENAALTAALDLHCEAMPVLTYLANEIRYKKRSISYATIAAIDLKTASAFGGFDTDSGIKANTLDTGCVILNDWAQEDLQAANGDSLQIEYYLSDTDGNLSTATTRLQLSGIVRKSGLAGKNHLTPAFPGMTDAPKIADWNPPFPVDLSKVRSRDEHYWEKYRALPKVFVSLATGQKMWHSRFGRLTSVWLKPQSADSTGFAKKFEKQFIEALTPESAGMIFQPTDNQTKSAGGATDFSQLFIGFSFFLIISAALLIGLLFRLAIEQRSKEIGMFMAMGYTAAAIQKNLFKEAGLLTAVGALIGVFAGIGYGALMIWGLRTLWVGATGTSALTLHVFPSSLAIGFFSALFLAGFTIVLMLRKFRQLPALRLISGAASNDLWGSQKPFPRKRYILICVSCLAIASLLVIYGMLLMNEPQPIIFFLSGLLLLFAGLLFAVIWLKNWQTVQQANKGYQISLMSIGIQNNNRHLGRSLLSIGLVAFATFLIISVGANRKGYQDESFQKDSGTGGYALMGESTIPLVKSLTTSTSRFELGITEKESLLLEKTTIFPLRLLPGEDASCLNLYKPERPRVLGVPPHFIQRGGFSFQKMLTPAENPWTLLDTMLPDDVIPAIGDANSVQWIMHSGLGQDMKIQTVDGKSLTIRFVALLNTSIFQSEVLISETAFLRLFPQQAGYQYFLVESPANLQDSVSVALESALVEFGMDMKSTATKLAEFQEVENTYLSVFQILGGLGLLLGTFGLGIVLIRNALERRGELATLKAFGFRESRIRKMLVSETAFQIIYGILIGTLSALIAILPQLRNSFAYFPWLELVATIGVVLTIALSVSYFAAYRVLKTALLPALKSE